MTVSSSTNSVSYTGNGATVDFAVTFKFFEIAVDEIASGVVTTKTEGTHYTVAGGDGATGTVTMLVAPASGVTLRIRRTTARTQEVDFAENDSFPAEVNEQAHDRLMMALQEIGQRANFNPTFGAQTGTLGAHTTLAHFAQFGDFVFFRARGVFTSIGTGAGYLTCTLPVTAHALGVTGVGRNQTNGALLSLFSVSTTVLGIVTASASAFPAVDGDEVQIAAGYFGA